MRVYLLPADFSRKLAAVKTVALLGAYLFIWLTHFRLHTHGPPWLYWGTFALLAVLNTTLLWNVPPVAERQERRYLLSFFLDLLAICYLTILHPQLYLILLIGLTLVGSFYNFVLPRSSGILVAFLTGVLYSFAILLGLTTATSAPALAVDEKLTPTDALALWLFGMALIVSSAWLVRKIRRSVDKIFSATDELAFDLTSQAIDASILVDEVVEKNQEIQTLLSVLQNIVSVLDWDDLFKNVVVAFGHRFTFDKFSLYLYREDAGELELVVEIGAEKVSGSSRRIKAGDGVVGWCFAHRRGVLIPDVREDARYKEFSERGKRIRSLICAPLVFRDESLGVMCLDSEKTASFDDKAFNFLVEIAPLISVAVSNSMSYGTAVEESFTDNLTGLKNHRGFMETFLPLLSDAYTEDFPLAVMVLDIDNFKKINDTYGHQVGNLILTDLADILRAFFRSSDLVARYGGEEFVVVLNSTPPETAPRIAEQLRRKVESHQFPISLQKDAFKQVTVSIGIATTADVNLDPQIATGSRSRPDDVYLRNDTELAECIIENADQALYVAKREGRNQVRLSFQYPGQGGERA